MTVQKPCPHLEERDNEIFYNGQPILTGEAANSPRLKQRGMSGSQNGGSIPFCRSGFLEEVTRVTTERAICVCREGGDGCPHKEKA